MLGCIYALLFAGVNTQWTSVHGGPAPQWAEVYRIVILPL